MAAIIVAARLPTAGGEARQKVIDHLTKASEYSEANEPGVLKYMICTPADTLDVGTVWAIEEYDDTDDEDGSNVERCRRYADKKALDDHMSTQPVLDMLAFMQGNPNVLAGAPTIRQLSWVDGMSFTKPEVTRQQDLFVIFAHLEFYAGKRPETLKYWKGNLECSHGEKGTFSYGIMEEAEKPDELFTLEVYESEEFLTDVHVKADAVQQNIKQTSELRKGLTLAKLKLHAGYVSR